MSLVRRASVLVAAALALAACAGGPSADHSGAQSSAPELPGTSAALGDSADPDTAASPTSGGASGSGTGDAMSTSGGLTGPGSDPPKDPCVEIVEGATEKLPADIILVVDNSGSMTIEAASVKANLNQFSTKIIASGVDAHVVLLSAIAGDTGICIAPPLGSGGCPAADSNPPTFLHLEQSIGSHDALKRLLASYAEWKGLMRPAARKHIVVVSDDDSKLDAASFDAAFRALDPSHEDYLFHAIVGQNDKNDPLWCTSEPICCDLTAAAGEVYLELIAQTGGVHGDLCKQDFTLVFDTLSTAVILNSGLACEWEIPAPKDDLLIDYDAVDVAFDDGMGAVLPLARVDAAAACPAAGDGWYYDDPAQPTALLLCPETCDQIQLAPGGSIRIAFGCRPLEPQ